MTDDSLTSNKRDPVSDTIPRGRAQPGVSGGYEYAGFWIRVGAYSIDGVVLYLIVLVIERIVSLLAGFFSGLVGVGEAVPAAAPAGLDVILDLFVGMVYFTVFPASPWQATPGKRLRRIHLIVADGGRITVPRAIGRYLAYLLSGLALGLGFMLAGWTAEKRALHDMICGTRVVYGRV